MADFLLLDATDFLLLSGGTDKLILGLEAAVPDGVVLEGAHSIAKYGDKRLDQQDKIHGDMKSLNRLGFEAPDTILKVNGRIRTKIKLRVESRIATKIKIYSIAKIMRESIRKVNGRVSLRLSNRYKVEAKVGRHSIHEITGKLPAKIAYNHNKKIKELKKLFDAYKETFDD